MIPGPTTKQNIYIVKRQDKDDNIGYVITEYFTNKLNKESKRIIDEMNKRHKKRLRTKHEIIGITSKKTIELNHKFYTKGPKISNEFYLTIQKNANELFMHWEHNLQNKNQELMEHFKEWENKQKVENDVNK